MFFGSNVVDTNSLVSNTYANLPTSLQNSSLRLWLDACDPYNTGMYNTMQTDLSGWKDKSQYGSHALAKTGASTSTTVKWLPAGFNGRPCFNFTGRTASKWIGGQMVNSSAIVTGTIFVFVVATNNSQTIGGILSSRRDL
jgi:hypothetical protein